MKNLWKIFGAPKYFFFLFGPLYSASKLINKDWCAYSAWQLKWTSTHDWQLQRAALIVRIALNIMFLLLNTLALMPEVSTKLFVIIKWSNLWKKVSKRKLAGNTFFYYEAVAQLVPQQTAIPYRPIFIYRRLNCCPNSKKIKNLNVAPCRKLPKILKNQPHVLRISSISPNEYNEPIPVLWYWMLKEL